MKNFGLACGSPPQGMAQVAHMLYLDAGNEGIGMPLKDTYLG